MYVQVHNKCIFIGKGGREKKCGQELNLRWERHVVMGIFKVIYILHTLLKNVENIVCVCVCECMALLFRMKGKGCLSF